MIPREGVRCVVGVAGIEAVHESGLNVGLIVAVGILHEHDVGLLRNIDTAVAELDAGGDVQPSGKHGLLVGLPIAVAVFEDQHLVIDGSTWEIHGIRRHRGNPESALRVDRHLHGLLQVGKLDL